MPRYRDVQGVAEQHRLIGGIFENKKDGSVTKYYQAFGRAIAMRDIPNVDGTTEVALPC